MGSRQQTDQKEKQHKAGARDFRCALQVNPSAYLKRFRGQDHGLGHSYAEAILSKCRELGIQVIGVTDHNDHSGVEEFRSISSKFGITVFPGFELCSLEGIHVLCLFDPDCSAEQLPLHLGGLGVHRPGPTADISAIGLSEILRVVWEKGGVTIAAHVTSNNGLLTQIDGQARVKLWQDEYLHAVQIPGSLEDAPDQLKPILENRNFQYRRKNPVAVLNACDISEPGDLEKAGAWSTISMSKPTIEGLRQAFLDPDSRIRLSSDDEVPEHIELQSISWEGGFLDGVRIDFNSRLNVLIGGRGSGKSTVIESLRYALQLQPLGDDAKKAHEVVVRQVLKNGTKIRVELRSPYPSSREYVIERSIPNLPTVRCGSKLLSLTPLEIVPRMEIYGQHEIAELAKSKDKLTGLLRRFIPEESASNQQIEEVRRALEQSREKILSLQREIAYLKEQAAEMPALEEMQRRYQETGLDLKLRARDLLVREKRVWTTAFERVAELSRATAALGEAVPLDTAFLAEKAIEEFPNRGMLDAAKPVLEDLSREVEGAAQRIDEAARTANQRLEDMRSVWQKEEAKEQESYERILRELQRERIDGGKFIEMRDRMEQIRPLQERLNQHEARLKLEEEKRESLLVDWADLNGSEFRRIERAAKKVGKALTQRVQVRVEANANRESFEQLLEQKLGGRLRETFTKLRELQDFAPATFARACRAGRQELIDQFGLTPMQASSLAAASQELILQIEELRLAPLTTIELNTGMEGQAAIWQRLENLSTGQKATAVLLLMLLESDAPLVIDQPEDDLDNRFISEGVVPRIRAEKRKRQFLFATHNANIPVLGDAELILPLTPQGESGASILMEQRGSIDEPEVRRQVEEILEGGRDAFETRRRKYGF